MRLEKERNEEATQISGRLEIIRLQDKVNMVLAKGATPEADKWNNTDLKVMIQWFKIEGDKAMPKNKDGLLLHYCETCTHVVSPVTYHEQDEEVAAHVATVSVGVGVPTARDGVASAAVDSTTDVLWLLVNPHLLLQLLVSLTMHMSAQSKTKRQ
jgi:hypothetical protein